MLGLSNNLGIYLLLILSANGWAGDLIHFPNQKRSSMENASASPLEPQCENMMAAFSAVFVKAPRLEELLNLDSKLKFGTNQILMLKGHYYSGQTDFLEAYARHLESKTHPYFFLQHHLSDHLSVEQNLNIGFQSSASFSAQVAALREERRIFTHFRSGGDLQGLIENYVLKIQPQEMTKGDGKSILDSWSTNPTWQKIQKRAQELYFSEYRYIFSHLNVPENMPKNAVFIFDLKWNVPDKVPADKADLMATLSVISDFAKIVQSKGSAVIMTFPEIFANAIKDSDAEELMKGIEVINYPLVL